VTFSVAVYPAPAPDVETFRTSLRQAADRLVALQHADGSWSVQIGGPADLASSGRCARALLAAHGVFADARYLRAAETTADAITAALPRSKRAASTGNLLFLAELGRLEGRSELTRVAAESWREQLVTRGCETPEASAAELMGRPNRTAWLDGAWRNYLLWHGGEMAELARAVGQDAWADAFTLAAAESWAPKRDHAWWTMGAGRMLEALADVRGPQARRLAAAETGLLRNDELAEGLPWNDTPYDTYVYTMESAAAIQGLLADHAPQARQAGLLGLAELVRRQSTAGGWGATLSLLDAPIARDAADSVPPADVAVDETPELDAEMVLTLASAVRALETSERYAPPALAGGRGPGGDA
jgi:hypothetical protein